jgi:UDPglucose 6-dehydrogenase
MRIVMIGAGYVGLTTGACLAQLGHSVTCVDVDPRKLAVLHQGRVPIYEPGLDEIVANNVANGRLSFSGEIALTCNNADAVFLAVGTPSRPDGAADLRFVEAAAREIAPVMRADTVVVVKSTVVAGTARRLREIIAERRGGLDFSVASNPEFLREGSAINDFLEPDRIVVGADDPRAARVLREIYAPLLEGGTPAVFTSTTNAELIKYAANSFLALKIGFINEVADLCEEVGGDVRKVAEGIGLDRRIGPAFLAAGPGFGGSCFPKDIRAFADTGRRHGAPQHLIETLIRRNEERKSTLAERIIAEAGAPTRRVAILGVAFKANTDDARESAAVSIVPHLLDAGLIVKAHDPQTRGDVLPTDVDWCNSAEDALRDADVAVILTDWAEYAALDLADVAALMRGRTIIDCRHLLDATKAQDYGFRLVAIGRPAPAQSNAERPAANRGGARLRTAAASV